MVKAQAKPIFRLLLTLCFIFSCFCFAGEQESQYDNLSFGIPGKADTIIGLPRIASRSTQAERLNAFRNHSPLR